MDNLIEIEIENRSYIELLNLNKINHKTINLTTLVDNQAAVKIKIFLNKSGDRKLLKEFYIRNLKLKNSGLPRFELTGSFNNNVLSLKLNVDGKKTDYSEINLRPYLRNKFLPLFVILSLIAVFLLFAGGKWLFLEFIFNDEAAPASIIKGEDTKSETAYEKPNKTNINIQTEELPKESEPEVVKTSEANSEAQSNAKEPVKKVIISVHTAYFPPNNTSIQKDTAQKLKELAKELKSTPNASVEISGHCAMTGTEEGRERLSKARAYNVLDYLKKEGWIPETEPVVKWYGGSRPVTFDQNEIYKNRRVEITIDIP